jgi:predicted CXXCH cytochrome family protein
VLVCALAFAAPAFAWTHGQFSTTTDACAGCHVAHAAQMPNLLKQGPTQTHFCFMCHGDGGTSAPYDVKDGITVAGSTYRPSTAGGFVRQWVDDGDNVLEAGELKNVTSRHNVWGFVYGEENTAVADTTDKYFWIPGGSSQLTGDGFVCTSCHDPHAGGVYDGNANPRLLRNFVHVGFQLATIGEFIYSAEPSAVYQVIRYRAPLPYGDTGISEWCGACHNKFQTDDGDNKAVEPAEPPLYFGMWRHPIDAHVAPPVSGGQIIMDPSIATGTPLVYRGYNVVYSVGCLTCHRAHSTTVAKTGWATTWPRDAADPATGKVLGDTTALLRMDSRGICYNCHGAGQYNCRNDTRFLDLDWQHTDGCSPRGYLDPEQVQCHSWTSKNAHGRSLRSCEMCHPEFADNDPYEVF